MFNVWPTHYSILVLDVYSSSLPQIYQTSIGPRQVLLSDLFHMGSLSKHKTHKIGLNEATLPTNPVCSCCCSHRAVTFWVMAKEEVILAHLPVTSHLPDRSLWPLQVWLWDFDMSKFSLHVGKCLRHKINNKDSSDPKYPTIEATPEGHERFNGPKKKHKPKHMHVELKMNRVRFMFPLFINSRIVERQCACLQLLNASLLINRTHYLSELSIQWTRLMDDLHTLFFGLDGCFPGLDGCFPGLDGCFPGLDGSSSTPLSTGCERRLALRSVGGTSRSTPLTTARL